VRARGSVGFGARDSCTCGQCVDYRWAGGGGVGPAVHRCRRANAAAVREHRPSRRRAPPWSCAACVRYRAATLATSSPALSAPHPRQGSTDGPPRPSVPTRGANGAPTASPLPFAIARATTTLLTPYPYPARLINSTCGWRARLALATTPTSPDPTHSSPPSLNTTRPANLASRLRLANIARVRLPPVLFPPLFFFFFFFFFFAFQM
jgi:hypothetical protein